MKERPILFNGAMVNAILEGRKTQTRRILKSQPPHEGKIIGPVEFSPVVIKKGEETCGDEVFGVYDEYGEWGAKCPYGKPGDRLWVREKFQYFWKDGCADTDLDYNTGKGYRVSYPATDGIFDWTDGEGVVSQRCFPSIHMPRWASRITLEIKNVRLERVMDICNSAADCKAEGLKKATKDGVLYKYGLDSWPWQEWHPMLDLAFGKLWISINGAGAWDNNPWVWVVEFEVVK